VIDEYVEANGEPVLLDVVASFVDVPAKRRRHSRPMRACARAVAASMTSRSAGCGDAAPTIQRPTEGVWCPADAPAEQAFDARRLLGMSPDDARADAERQG
jgi:hypothetical protein